jgi:hypothetical protein
MKLILAVIAATVIGGQSTGPKHETFAGRWTPVESSTAKPPSSLSGDDIGEAMGGPMIVTEDVTTITIDNGVVTLVCGPDPMLRPPPEITSSAPLRKGDSRCVLTAKATAHKSWGWATWMGLTPTITDLRTPGFTGSNLILTTFVVRLQVGTRFPETLQLAYYKDHEQLVLDRTVGGRPAVTTHYTSTRQ